MTTTHDDKAIEAAEKLAALYEGDERQDIKTDVMNAFYAGIKFARAALSPASTGQEADHIVAVQIVHVEAGRTLSKTDFDMCVRIAKRALAAPAQQVEAEIRDKALEEAEAICRAFAEEHWDAYKRGNGPGRGNPYVEGNADGADECADRIAALKSAAGKKGAGGE